VRGGGGGGDNVINPLDPIEELYDMYLEEEKTPRIVKVANNRLGFDSDNEDGPADLYLELYNKFSTI